eukprot:TRINITY_DN8261_c0_g1_i1.p1 TRINITY_DN8261_c0_g1~~TRINITY_DN8261_c0_g1_i1.p1  ORF type:complete len:923 (+),score=268.89 TRINITY_DN8261_c0_g1_i1:369-2771(+)
MVEVYPLELRLVHNANKRDIHPISISRAATIGQLKARGCAKFGIDPSKVKLINYYLEIRNGVLDDESKTIEEARVSDKQRILFEEEGVGPAPPVSFASASSSSASSSFSSASSSYSSSYSSASRYPYSSSSQYGRPGASSSYPYSSSTVYDRYRKETIKGLTGLTNLGNTCFMNAALQCLSNSVALRDYFLRGDHLRDLNRENVLGMKGRVAEEFAALVKQLWAGTHSVVAPRSFKMTLGDFAPQFSGFAQHDSQELLSFLLDGLHEDLNRVRAKPYVEALEADDSRSDEEWADISWQQHLKRNRSVIVDLFQGQFKSTIVCPDCEHVSITFDPFMYLSLPLQDTVSSLVTVFLVWDDKYPPTKFVLRLKKNASVREAREALAKLAGLNPAFIVFGSVRNHDLVKSFMDRETVADLLATNVFAYHIPELPDVPFMERVIIPVVHLMKKPKSLMAQATTECIAYPSMLNFSRARTTKRMIIDKMWPRVKTFLKLEFAESIEYSPKLFSLVFVETKTHKEMLRVDCAMDDHVEFPSNSNLCHLALEWNYKEWLRIGNASRAMSCNADPSVEGIKNEKESVTLLDCFNAFTAPEILGEDDMVYCRKCKEHKQSSKKFDIWKFPEYLVVHLKRFSYSRYRRDKLSTFVDFPLEALDLSQYEMCGDSGPAIFDLYAVSNHFGGLGGGHYTAYAFNDTTSKWYNFEDSSVTSADKGRVVTGSGYVLFYHRRGGAGTARDGGASELPGGTGQSAAPNEAASSTSGAPAPAPVPAPAPASSTSSAPASSTTSSACAEAEEHEEEQEEY